MKIERFYVVYKATIKSEISDIFNCEITRLENLYHQFQGGLKPETIQGIFTEKAEAETEAKRIYEKLISDKFGIEKFILPEQERFKRFIAAMEEISTKYGVIVSSTGGVTILDKQKQIYYSKDHTSSDLGAYY